MPVIQLPFLLVVELQHLRTLMTVVDFILLFRPQPVCSWLKQQATSGPGGCPFPTAVVWAQPPPTMPEWAQMPIFGFMGPPRHVDPAHVPLIAQVSSLEGPMTQTLQHGHCHSGHQS